MRVRSSLNGVVKNRMSPMNRQWRYGENRRRVRVSVEGTKGRGIAGERKMNQGSGQKRSENLNSETKLRTTGTSRGPGPESFFVFVLFCLRFHFRSESNQK